MAPGNVRPDLVKWWKAFQPTYGEVTRHVSPYKLQLVAPMFRVMGTNLKYKVKDNWKDVTPAAVMFVGLVGWAEWKYEDIAHHHRS